MIEQYNNGYKKCVKNLLRNAKYRAKKQSLPFNLEKSDIVIPKICPVLGTELSVLGVDPYKFPESIPSLDKIIPNLGYVKENIQVISLLANRMKSNATPDQLSNFGKWAFIKFNKWNDNIKPPIRKSVLNLPSKNKNKG